jgi:hypothetical protein
MVAKTVLSVLHVRLFFGKIELFRALGIHFFWLRKRVVLRRIIERFNQIFVLTLSKASN